MEIPGQISAEIDTVRVEWILDADCAEVAADHPFIAAFQGAAARASLDPRLSGFGAHSDIGLPTGLGRTPTVNFGAGDPAQSHQPNEHVSISGLVACTKAIALALESWRRKAT
jgi:acetylornithine deacetylase